MTKTTPSDPRTVRGVPVRPFVRHYVEMVVAMIVGMAALEPLWTLVLPPLGASVVLERPDLHALLMATDMTVGMSLWMWYRGHGWIPVGEMAAAMYLPFIVLFVPFWTGVISADSLFIAGHLLMLPAMLLAMLRRPHEYSRHDHRGSRARGHDSAAVTVPPTTPPTSGRPGQERS